MIRCNKIHVMVNNIDHDYDFDDDDADDGDDNDNINKQQKPQKQVKTTNVVKSMKGIMILFGIFKPMTVCSLYVM